MSILATVQSNYIPWKGYFDLINKADIFVFRDDVQYTKDSWRNRNRIITANGPIWLTIPVRLEHHDQISSDIKIADPDWAEKHWRRIDQHYRTASYFSMYKDAVKDVYEKTRKMEYLCSINHEFIRFFCYALSIETPLMPISNYQLSGDRNEKLIDLCRQANCNTYLSGPTAKVYIDNELFEKNGIKVEYMQYGPYPEYKQSYTPFNHEVSILDLFFHTGSDARKYMEPI